MSLASGKNIKNSLRLPTVVLSRLSNVNSVDNDKFPTVLDVRLVSVSGFCYCSLFNLMMLWSTFCLSATRKELLWMFYTMHHIYQKGRRMITYMSSSFPTSQSNIYPID